MKPIDILLVEDNPADADLTREHFEEARILNRLHVVSNGVEALEFLRKQGVFTDAERPDLILLDLNLPKMDGRQLLALIKQDADLKLIPVVILSASQAETDIIRSYQLHANAYVTKPVDLDGFSEIVKAIEGFWLSIVKLPPNDD